MCTAISNNWVSECSTGIWFLYAWSISFQIYQRNNMRYQIEISSNAQFKSQREKNKSVSSTLLWHTSDNTKCDCHNNQFYSEWPVMHSVLILSTSDTNTNCFRYQCLGLYLWPSSTKFMLPFPHIWCPCKHLLTIYCIKAKNMLQLVRNFPCTCWHKFSPLYYILFLR